MIEKKLDIQRPYLYPKQYNAFYNDSRISVIEASTKAGKTSAALIWLLEKALKFSQTSVKQGVFWWVAPVYSQAKIAFNRMKRSLPSSFWAINESELKLTLKHNDAVIFFKSGEKPDSLYGEDVQAVVIDEASRVREEAFFAVRSTLTATQGPARIIGNVRGRNNWAYKLGVRAKNGEEGMEYHCITARDAVAAGVLNQSEIDDAEKLFKGRESFFKELYFCEPAEDGGNPFGIRAIRDCIKPISSSSAVVWGWDFGRSIDWTVGIALDSRGYVCRFHRFQKPWKETVDFVIREVRDTKTLVDSTGIGDVILDTLQRGRDNIEGYKFTSTSKQMLMEGLALAISGEKIAYPEGPIVDELECFEYKDTANGTKYSAPDGLHDDCVCALALASYALFSRPVVGNLTKKFLFSDNNSLAVY